MPYDQTTRVLKIETELGEDMAVLTEMDGQDALSRPFVFNIRFATTEADDKVRKLLGTKVSLSFGLPGEIEGGPLGLERRVLNGHFRRLRRIGTSFAEEAEWYGEVVPAVWFLSRTTDCRIFQGKTVTTIIEDILKLHKITDYKMKTTGSYPTLDYCVQYRESALDFITRLMEQNGIFFWHEHANGKHTLVIGDENGSTVAPAFPDFTVDARPGADGLRSLDEDFAVRSGKWTMRDFNFETPSNSLEVTDPTQVDVEATKERELYDYPGLYPVTGDGRTFARIQIEHEESLYHLRRGTSTIAALDAGARLKIADVEESEVLVTEIRHHGIDRSHWTPERLKHEEVVAPHYENEFVCLPRKVPFRSPRVTPKPFVRGPQTAIVTGPSGEEIHTDKYGRVKVKFHWDRVGKKDDTSSCWVRVSQGIAGAGWGQIHIPRMGQEVIVDFLEGDPDRPIITGRVYNAESNVPYALPANKTQSGIKTNSSKGGGGSNEIRLEDKKSSEQVYVHAEKDLDTEVENNETRKVGLKGTGNRTTNIKNDETITVGGNRTETVMKNETITIQQNRTEMVAKNEAVAIGMSREHAIGIADSLTVGAARSHSVGATEWISIGASQSISVGSNQTTEVGSNQSTQVGKNQTTSVGDNSSTTVGKNGTVSIGKSFKLDAGDEIVLTTGSAQIIMKKNGDITIKGKNITIDASGKVSVKASSDVVMKGQKILQN